IGRGEQWAHGVACTLGAGAPAAKERERCEGATCCASRPSHEGSRGSEGAEGRSCWSQGGGQGGRRCEDGGDEGAEGRHARDECAAATRGQADPWGEAARSGQGGRAAED